MPPSPAEQMYQSIIMASEATSGTKNHLVSSLDTYAQSPWFGSWESDDPLNDTFPTDKSIVEVMYLEETLWDDGHHHSSFLPIPCDISACPRSHASFVPNDPFQNPILIHEVLSEGNMGNITPTIPINISEIFTNVSWSPHELNI